MKNLISVFKQTLPDILWRHRWASYKEKYGVPFARGTMQNFDSAGNGPKLHTIRGTVYYTKTEFLDWLQNYDEPS